MRPQTANVYGARLLISTLRRQAADHHLAEQPGRVVLTCAVLVLSRVMGVASSALLGSFAAAQGFVFSRFGASRAAATAGDSLDALPDAFVDRLLARNRINDRVAEAIVYRPAATSVALPSDLLLSVETGKQAGRGLLVGAVDGLLGSALSVIASIGFLVAINPVMGVIGLLSVPAMVLASRHAGARAAARRDAELAWRAETAKVIADIGEGGDVHLASPDRERAGARLHEALSASDAGYSARAGTSALRRALTTLPYQVAMTAAGLVGALILHLPLAAVVTSMLITGWVYFPIRQALRFLTEDAPVLVRDVDTMYRAVDSAAEAALAERRLDLQRTDAASIRKATVSLNGARDSRIARAVRFTAAPGRITALTGPSGCGKTTVLRAVAGLTALDHGEARIGGVPVGSIGVYAAPGRRRLIHDLVSYQPQQPVSFPAQSVLRNVLAGSRLAGGNDVDTQTRCHVGRALREVGLEALSGDLDRPLGTISGGEQARLAVARTAVGSADVVLCDEPTTGLDAVSRLHVLAYLSRLAVEGKTVLVATHDPALIERADRVVNLAPAGGKAPRGVPSRKTLTA